MRNLILILGDQLDRDSSIFDGLDPTQDLLWMAECAGEATHVWSHKARIAMFLAATRHFRDELVANDLPLRYRDLQSHDHANLVDALREDIEKVKPQRLLLVMPGDGVCTRRSRRWPKRAASRTSNGRTGISCSNRPNSPTGRRPPGAAHGVFLPLGAQAAGRADGRWQARRRHVEL